MKIDAATANNAAVAFRIMIFASYRFQGPIAAIFQFAIKFDPRTPGGRRQHNRVNCQKPEVSANDLQLRQTVAGSPPRRGGFSGGTGS